MGRYSAATSREGIGSATFAQFRVCFVPVTDFFFRLTPDWVLRAVEAGGYRPTGHCSALGSLENRVYDLRLEDGSHIVVKFYRPGRWSAQAILEEHRFLFALHDAEIPVCAPVPFSDGKTLHEVEGILYAIWPRTGGRAPEELSDGEVEVLGRLLARIHNLGEALAPKHRRTINAEAFGLEPLKFLEQNKFLTLSCARRYRAAVETIADIYHECVHGIALHAIHGDCHRGNLLHGAQGWFFLDFDDFGIGPAVHDMWMLLPGRDVEAAQQRRVLIESYRQFRNFDERSLALIEPLRALRFVHYAAWIARRWQDPAFPNAFPHFGSEEYWERETRDLEDQIEVIESGASAVGEMSNEAVRDAEPEEALTNKDFYWDL